VQNQADPQSNLNDLPPEDHPPSCDGRFFISECSAGPEVINDMFVRKFGSTAPEHGHHIIAWYRNDWRSFVPVSYVNFLPWSSVILVGGACTDGGAFKQMSPEHPDQIRAAGGAYFYLLRFAFHRFADQCEAYFGHVGDARAEEVDLKAGFNHTGHKHLVACFHKPTSDERNAELTEEIHKLGAF
jgi:hypothetical protein